MAPFPGKPQLSLIGTTLAHYEILESVGRGGMGEVYRARDTKLTRDVALKVLPKELASDPERIARFQREARTLASLQHSNVASIHGFDVVDGIHFLVMELVEGENLAVRLQRGAVSPEETRVLARQIAAGLEAAHERGIVHRDLKPANIMITSEGQIKILDFGLARAWFGEDSESGDIALSPTITAAMTQAGTILGTAAYMSPEQARGKKVDRRADIWAFGVILWEMLTGYQLFEGETVSDTLAAVLRAEPEWSELPRDEAPALCHLIERCLQRDPRFRLRDIGEARILLEDASANSSRFRLSAMGGLPATGGGRDTGRSWFLLIAVAVLFLLLGSILGWKILGRPPASPVLHAMIPAPGGTRFRLIPEAPGPARLSPDGRKIVFTAQDEDGVTALYLRYLDQDGSNRLTGTENAVYPFWSPDSRFIGFFTTPGDKLRKVAVRGGPPVTLCAAPNGKGGTWNRDGVILFAPSHNTVIHRVQDTGGEPVALTRLGSDEDSHRHPRFLPDGRHFLFLARKKPAAPLQSIYLASLDDPQGRVVAQSVTQAEYSRGHLLTVRERTLLSTPFDPEVIDRSPTGGTPLVENILSLGDASVGVFSATSNGTLIYQTGSTMVERVLQIVDLGSHAVSTLGLPGSVYYPRVSPDGRHAVVEVENEGEEGTDLWLVDLETGLRTRFTFAPGDETHAVWTPDGSSIIYSAIRDSVSQIIQEPVEGTGGSAVLLEDNRYMAPTSVRPDGNTLLFDHDSAGTGLDIEQLPLPSGGEATPVLVTAQGEADGQFSPDGRWIAYLAQSPAGWDIFVMPAEGGARKWQITTGGAVYPRWTDEGKELWVNGFEGEITAYSVDGSGNTFKLGPARAVAKTGVPTVSGVSYDLYPGSQKILQAVRDATRGEQVSQLHLVTDWQRALVH